MSVCALVDSPDVELYFYGELDAAERARVDAHVRGCAGCRQRLDDLAAIRRALAVRPVVDAPPGHDWSAFTRRLDAAVAAAAQSRESGDRGASLRALPAALVMPPRRGSAIRPALALAAMLAVVIIGVVMAARVRHAPPAAATGDGVSIAAAGRAASATSATSSSTNPDRSLREVTAEHLERSKLVVLGLATRDPRQTRADDWEYERHLAATLLTDTRLYRLQALDRGMSDIARVMRDLETVLIEASMSQPSDRDALERVQNLISKRDLMVKMHVVASNSAGI